MLLELAVAGGIVAFMLHWLIPAIRKRIEFEIEFGAAVASLWMSMYVLWVRGKTLVPIFRLPGWVVAGGLALWLLSIALFIASVVLLRTRGEPKRGWEETTELSTGGLHGLVRHPMQLGVALAAVGIALMRPATPVVILCVPPAVLAVRAAFAEDRYNISKFGNRYLEYMEAVPRLNLALGIWRRIVRAGQAGRSD